MLNNHAVLLIVSLLLSVYSRSTAAKHHAHEWPPIHHETIFSSKIHVYQLSESKIEPFKHMQGQVLVDSSRNQMKGELKIELPLFGLINWEILMDFSSGWALTYIPLIDLCEAEQMDLPRFQLGEVLSQVFDEASGITQYLGTHSTPWKSHHHHHNDEELFWKF